MAVTVARVDWDDPRSAPLLQAMDAEMNALYAPSMADVPVETIAEFLSAIELHPEDIVASVIAIDDGADSTADSAGGNDGAGTALAVGHAALRQLGDSLEVKKVVVSPSHRGRGISKMLMAELESIARERGAHSLMLQTGNLQPEAIALYKRIGYVEIPVFGKYGILPVSVCFEKVLE